VAGSRGTQGAAQLADHFAQRAQGARAELFFDGLAHQLAFQFISQAERFTFVHDNILGTKSKRCVPSDGLAFMHAL
jgi:hypothetical protein